MIYVSLLSVGIADDISRDALDRIASRSSDPARSSDWEQAVVNYGDKHQRKLIRAALKQAEPFPKSQMVAYLGDERLAVRIGAIEILEDFSGKQFDYDPWDTPASDEHHAALSRWMVWAGSKGEKLSASNQLTDDQMQSYIRDLISSVAERQKRALRMLEPYGMLAVGDIQEFIVTSPDLLEHQLVRLKEAQYYLVLTQTRAQGADSIARSLTRGNRDQVLEALSQIKTNGFLVIPIVLDFVNSSDALVRETAIDTALLLGNAEAVPLVADVLAEEADVNVIHVAMRRLREIGGQAAVDLIVPYLARNDEDLLVSTIQSLTKLSKAEVAGRNTFYSSNSEGEVQVTDELIDQVLPYLTDERWRVRSAALEFVVKVRTERAAEQVLELLSDEDEFVRSGAVQAVVALKLTSARSQLEEMFLSNDDLVPMATSAFVGLDIQFTDSLLEHLRTRPVDVIIACLSELEKSSDEGHVKLVASFSSHEDLDIACSAIRILAKDSKKVEKIEAVSAALLEALTSGQLERISAVIDHLRLPKMTDTSAYLAQVVQLKKSQVSTKLDSLYDAFNQVAVGERKQTEKQLESSSASSLPDNVSALRDELAKVAASESEQAFRAGIILAKSGDNRGAEELLKSLAGYSVSQRSAVAAALRYTSTQKSSELTLRLLNDDAETVQEDAAQSAFSESKNLALISEALSLLDLPGRKIHASALYCRNLESSARDRDAKRAIHSWCIATLKNDLAEDDQKVLALTLSRQALDHTSFGVVSEYTKNASQWLRRAAWYTVAGFNQSWLEENAERGLSDVSPRVREALLVALSDRGQWQVYFSDTHQRPDSSWNYNRKKPRISGHVLGLIKGLANDDPDERVRFEALYTLLYHGQDIDLADFISLLSTRAGDKTLTRRLGSFIEDQYKSLGPGIKPLLAYVDWRSINKRKRPLILKHFAGSGKQLAFTSFQDLAKMQVDSSLAQHSEEPEITEPVAERETVRALVFYKPGCSECETLDAELNKIKGDFPQLVIEHKNILEPSSMLLNQALCDYFQVSGVGKTPSLFVQSGAAISPSVQPEHIMKLVVDTLAMPLDDSWADMGDEAIELAEQKIDQSFANMTLPVVIGAGLLDGVNPCAFATIIFFLSYLQVARRSPREILMVGASFISAIFLSYFAVGIAFHSVIDKLNQLDGFQWVKHTMTYLFAAFAFLVAILSFRDSRRAAKGNLKDMTLQLPAFLKDKIRGVIRKRAKARHFVLAAFVSGVIISILELACTGQVYAPIIFQIQKGEADAVVMLLIYNLAFILPLVVIFALAFRGMTSSALIDFQNKHTATVKLATSIVFVLLGVLILFGDKLLPHA
ncbi:HEAT repeat domain-containing protein [Persicirhabdus sediminis]|uniref:HEAT repeat domain-containing protein n=1 Tax=Persicirhabdus sediminis TaxID=454144 RepID=A0A8J7SG80_9BACT|nr:HEAT repeat domain-containing protein [Persicirhabdus sediminis]MBK1789945.1 HEAT repeat domain-containing protein [Persicirhabdus sediminis]